MDILFRSNRDQKTFSQDKELVRAFGKNDATRIRARLDDLRAAATLADISHLPPARCHELVGDRVGQLSVDVSRNDRLLFEPYHDPIPQKPDGGLDWSQVTAILILGVEDTHE